MRSLPIALFFVVLLLASMMMVTATAFSVAVATMLLAFAVVASPFAVTLFFFRLSLLKNVLYASLLVQLPFGDRRCHGGVHVGVPELDDRRPAERPRWVGAVAVALPGARGRKGRAPPGPLVDAVPEQGLGRLRDRRHGRAPPGLPVAVLLQRRRDRSAPPHVEARAVVVAPVAGRFRERGHVARTNSLQPQLALRLASPERGPNAHKVQAAARATDDEAEHQRPQQYPWNASFFVLVGRVAAFRRR